MCCRLLVAIATAVPEAAVDEDCDLLASIRDVGGPRDAPVMLSISLAERPEMLSYDEFRDGILASYACHDAAACLFIEIVDHVKL